MSRPEHAERIADVIGVLAQQGNDASTAGAFGQMFFELEGIVFAVEPGSPHADVRAG